MKKINLLALLIILLLFSGCKSKGASGLPDQANIIQPKIIETENGWYFNKKFDASSRQYLHFKDKKTGKTIPLCNKPECTHIGNPFCAAASERFVSDMTIYKDKIYIVSCTPFDMIDKTDVYDTRLFVQSLDGTERTELATAVKYKGFTIVNRADITVCNDVAYITYKTPGENYFLNSGLVMIDINTGKVIKRFDELTTEDVDPQYGYMATDSLRVYGKVVPYGDYVYYSHHDERIPRANGYLYRYNAKTDATERLPINKSFEDFCIVDGDVVFIDETNDHDIGLYKLSVGTGETTALGEPFITGNNIVPARKLLYDNENICVVDYVRKKCYAFEKNGAVSAEFELPELTSSIASVNIFSGKLYLSDVYGNTAYYCPMTDILADNIHWEPAYEMQAPEDQ